jgi:phage tail-like protein
MTNSEFKKYYFNDPEHWKVGVFDNLLLTDDGGLGVTAGFVVEAINGSDDEEATSALDYGACNQLYWVRPASGELIRLHDFGPQPVGTLSEAKEATQLTVGRERLWLLTPGGINSYVLRGLHPLRQLKRQRRILDMAGDGCDGIWWLEGGDLEKAMLYHADRYGCLVAQPIPLPMPLNQGALDISSCGRKIVILDQDVPESERIAKPCGKEKAHWRMIIIDDVGAKEPFIIDEIGTLDANFKPQLFTLGRDKKIYLIDPVTAWLWTLSWEGALLDRHHLPLAQDWLPVLRIVAGDRLTLATAGGIATLRLAETTGKQDQERLSTFMSPTLTSPDGTPRGWQRADIDVVLPVGTTLEVKCAATRERNLASKISELLADNSRSSEDKIAQMNQLLVWREEDMVLYAGSERDDGATLLRYPLHQIDQTYLWLSFTLYTPPERKPPALKSLSVYYPNLSYLRYLPGVYQQDPHSAIQLRSFLAIFETLFGDLDTLIGQLPEHIDPNTAPESWLSFLLSWLGLPSPDSLSPAARRNLLKAAPELLAGRGTLQALQRLLEIITADNGTVTIEIDDITARPMPWVLQTKERKDLSARLGIDTLIVAQKPAAFRLGIAQLGKAKGVPLGLGWIKPQQIFAQHTGELKIRIRSNGDIKKRLEPLLTIFLPYFVPAHCRYRLEFLSIPQQHKQQRIDVDLYLQDGKRFQLGKETVLGRFRLPVMPVQEIVLDRNARLDCGLHLN